MKNSRSNSKDMIKATFEEGTPPSWHVKSPSLYDADKEDVAFFMKLGSGEVDDDALVHAIYALPRWNFDAFRYFLPKILIALVECDYCEKRLVDMILDALCDPQHDPWTEHFKLLNGPQLSAIEAWILDYSQASESGDKEVVWGAMSFVAGCRSVIPPESKGLHK